MFDACASTLLDIAHAIFIFTSFLALLVARGDRFCAESASDCTMMADGTCTNVLVVLCIQFLSDEHGRYVGEQTSLATRPSFHVDNDCRPASLHDNQHGISQPLNRIVLCSIPMGLCVRLDCPEIPTVSGYPPSPQGARRSRQQHNPRGGRGGPHQVDPRIVWRVYCSLLMCVAPHT